MGEVALLVVGAGPTGLLFAIWVKTLSPQTPLRIVDRRPGPRQQSRAIIIHARTLEFYRQLGIVDEVLQEGTIVKTAEIVLQGQVQGILRFNEVGLGQSLYPFFLSYPQDKHEELLIRQASKLGIEVEWNKKVADVQVTDDKIAVTFEDGEVSRHPWVIGCDGSGSVVRKSAGAQLEGNPKVSRFFVADGYLRDKSTDIAGLQIHIGDQGLAICVPLDQKGHVRVLGQVLPEAPEDATFDDVKAYAETTINQSIDQVQWSSIYNVSHCVASKFRRNGVFLLGDAAHVHSPVGGQGMNTGLGDASNLAWKLVSVIQGRLKPEMLDTYEDERRSFARILVQTTDRVFTFVTRKGYVGAFARKIMLARVVPFLWAYTPLPRFFFMKVSQTAITYSDRIIGSGGSKHVGVQIGDRLPYVRFEKTDNHESLRRCDWQVHFYQHDESIQVRDVIHDIRVVVFPWDKDVASKGLQKDTYYLLRPDGHVAAIEAAAIHADAFGQFFKRWFESGENRGLQIQ